MMRVKNGTISSMTTDFLCENGTSVPTNGAVTKKDGSQTMLKENAYMDVSGKVLSLNNLDRLSDNANSKPKKDKTMYLVTDSTLKKNN